VWSAALAQLARILTRAFEADLDGLFFAYTMANLAGRILAYACGSEAQAVALMDNLINGLARERAVSPRPAYKSVYSLFIRGDGRDA
jgi:hypothetical protein